MPNMIFFMVPISPDAMLNMVLIKGTQYVSARDIITYRCMASRFEAAHIWRQSKEAMAMKSHEVRLGGKTLQPVITIPDALKLIECLTEEVQKRNLIAHHALQKRVQLESILNQYHSDLSTNVAVSVNVPEKTPIAEEPIVNVPEKKPIAEKLDHNHKRQRHLEDTELQAKKLNNVSLFATTMTLLNPKWTEDPQLRSQTETWLKNAAFNMD